MKKNDINAYFKVTTIILGVAGAIGLSVTHLHSVPTSPTTTEDSSQQWRVMTSAESQREWENILNSPLAIAALNQLAVEGFISPDCPKTFYLNERFGGLQTLLRVKCSTGRGVSTALDYKEVRVIFNRFEDNIEDFQVERVSMPEKPPTIPLPD